MITEILYSELLIKDNKLFYIISNIKQKTAYEMRISDWSTDVCSSDLQSRELRKIGTPFARHERHRSKQAAVMLASQVGQLLQRPRTNAARGEIHHSQPRRIVVRIFHQAQISQDRKSTRLNSSH